MHLYDFLTCYNVEELTNQQFVMLFSCIRTSSQILHTYQYYFILLELTSIKKSMYLLELTGIKKSMYVESSCFKTSKDLFQNIQNSEFKYSYTTTTLEYTTIM